MDIKTILESPDMDIDLSFTSTCTSTTATTDGSFSSLNSSSARTSLASLSFNDLYYSSTTSRLPTTHPAPPSPSTYHHHHDEDPHWSAIKEVTDDGTIPLHLRHLKLHRHLGSGNLGRVYLCSIVGHQECYFALKVVDTNALTNKNQLSHIQTESEILSMLCHRHPFLPTLYANINVSQYTCLLIDYCPSGDLHSLLVKQPGNRFSIQTVLFFASEVLVALEYLHALGIVYRDLKPENILIREDGHIMLSDFDLCLKANVVPTLHKTKKKKEKRKITNWFFSCFRTEEEMEEEEEELVEFVAEPTMAYSKACVGTHEYLAPEIVNGTGHSNGVDWWAFGVFIHELLYGRTPFKGASKQDTLRNILSSRSVRLPLSVAEMEEEDVEETAARDLISRLLVKDPRRRLGCTRGAADIKQHPFFKEIKWPLIRTYAPPPDGRLGRKMSLNRPSTWRKSSRGRSKPRRQCTFKAFSQQFLSKYQQITSVKNPYNCSNN